MPPVVGSSAFFLTHGFKENAARAERELARQGFSDVSQIFYLEAIDAPFSIDGVLGAFTLSGPLILLGNGLGAFPVRELTLHNVERIKRYAYLKNGAMYSIACLGTIMLLEAFAVPVPSWLSPLATFGVGGYFYRKSRLAIASAHARQTRRPTAERRRGRIRARRVPRRAGASSD